MIIDRLVNDQWRDSLKPVAVRPYANNINDKPLSVCSSTFRSRHLLLAVLATRNSQLPACRRCRLRIFASATPLQALPYRRPGAGGTDVGGGSLAARHGQCGQAQKANAIRGGDQIFSLLSLDYCIDNRSVTGMRIPYRSGHSRSVANTMLFPP
jgi:hypothetical protein